MADRQPYAIEQLRNLPLVYPVPAAEPLRRSFIYRSVQDQQLQADLYYSAALPDHQQYLTVVMVHGGPVSKHASPKDWCMFRDYAKLLTALGVITVVFNHRLHGPAEYFTAQGDLVALLDYLRAHATSYNVDADRLLLWAFDGSGPLLSVALEPRRSYIRGLIAYYCSLDFPTGKAGPTGPREILESLSPATQLRRYGCKTPMLLARAGRDSVSVNRTLATFLDAALDCEAMVELLNHPNAESSFDVRTEDARSREIISRTLEFIRIRAVS